MVVEPESYCWTTGWLAENRNRETWAEEFRRYPSLEYIVRDGGSGLSKGVRLVQAERPELTDGAGRLPHAGRGTQGIAKDVGHRGRVRWSRRTCSRRNTIVWADRGQSRQGKGGVASPSLGEKRSSGWTKPTEPSGPTNRRPRCWPCSRPKVKLNDRAGAQRTVAEALEQLTGPAWAKTRRLLEKPEAFTFLDRLHQKLDELNLDPSTKADAIRYLGGCRCSWLWTEASPRSRPGSRVGVAGSNSPAGRSLLASRGCPSSADAPVELASEQFGGRDQQCCRMHQSRHRRMTQGLMDLKRFYWNLRPFRTGRRRDRSPYALLGLSFPTDDWWALLQLDPQTLVQELSAQ